MNDTIIEFLKKSFFSNSGVKSLKPELERLLYEGKITSYKAAIELIDKYHLR